MIFCCTFPHSCVPLGENWTNVLDGWTSDFLCFILVSLALWGSSKPSSKVHAVVRTRILVFKPVSKLWEHGLWLACHYPVNKLGTVFNLINNCGSEWIQQISLTSNGKQIHLSFNTPRYLRHNNVVPRTVLEQNIGPCTTAGRTRLFGRFVKSNSCFCFFACAECWASLHFVDICQTCVKRSLGQPASSVQAGRGTCLITRN